ncbi:hsp70 nucleotide exchange factor FES [Salix suchowensis]|nr:hsp70 nucleotide exchange factor FES [Salix suchowensis]
MECVVLGFCWPRYTAVILTAATVISGERVNRTSATAGLVWSKGKLKSDLLSKPEQGNSDDSSAGADDDLDRGFSSLDGMLQWAIEGAEDAQWLPASELQKRQLEIKELIEKMKMPSDAQLMQIAIDDLKFIFIFGRSPTGVAGTSHTYLNKLGGLAIVIQELNHPDPGTRRLSAWVLGKACQNNPVAQKQILELGALTKLIKMVKSTSIEEAIKALYAVLALIQNKFSGQELFYAEAGDAMLQEKLSNSNSDIRLCRKAVFLVADLVECQLENMAIAECQLENMAIAEPLLQSRIYLLQLKTTEALIFKDFCDLNGSLERMRLQLLDLMASEDHRDYAVDLETLRREVMKVPARRDIYVPMQFL